MQHSTFSTEELLRWDRQYVWHPFTPMKSWCEKSDPPVIVRGEKEFLIDSRGRRYIDGVSSLWCNVHGHCIPELDQAVREQLGKIAHSSLLGLCNEPSILLAKRLAEIAPGRLSRVFFSDDGSTAVEVAAKMAFQYWRNCGQSRRTRFIALDSAYHGDTLGAVSLGGIELFHRTFSPLCFAVDRVRPPALAPFSPLNATAAKPSEAAARFYSQAMADIEVTLLEHRNEYAAIVIEPHVQGAGGMLMHPPGFLTALGKLAAQYDVLLIADEVMTGFGRTGRMFACEHEGFEPDLLCLSKGLTAGYMPLGATLASERVYQSFYADPQENKTFYHGHTFTGHPLACAVALASHDLFEKHSLLEHVGRLSLLLHQQISPLLEHPNVGDIRQLGLVAAVDLVASRQPRTLFPSHWRVGGAVCTQLRDEGVILRPLADTLVIMPPLAASEQSVAHLGQAIVKVMAQLPQIIANIAKEHA
ncbi:MAG: adenosylmethionine--8-amino-7-oxononanoate transaminase [Phycisphaerales bacterium]|nr:adenosylmethionine--8-amino-7-oxononanoate transaminase [Phycisphaerales bacterium]